MVAGLEGGGSYNAAVHAPAWPTSRTELEVEAGLREPEPRTLREHVAANRRAKGDSVVDGALVVMPGDAA